MYTVVDQKNIGIPDILREVKVILMFKLMVIKSRLSAP
jgi:hypothetical protein